MKSSFYTHVSQLYDIVYESRTNDIGFYRSQIEQAAAAGATTIMEIGAGTGRVLLPIASALPDVRFTALDTDGDELSVLQRKIHELGLDNVDIQHGDLHSLSPGRFDLVTAPFRVLQHCLTLSELRSAFGKVHGALRPGGSFVFDVFNPSIPALTSDGRILTQQFQGPNGIHIRRVVDVNTRDYFAQTQHIEEYYTIDYPDGTADKLEWIYDTRYHFIGEIDPLLRATGLKIVNLYSNFDGAAFGEAPYPGEIVFVTKKAL